NILYVLGSPELILSSSSQIDNDGDCKELLLSDYKKIKDKIDQITSDGLRVVATGYKIIHEDKIIQGENNGKLSDLVFVGFFALHDPIRSGTNEVIDICRQAGMKPVIVTGDHKLTAKAVAAKLGFKVADKNILEGKDLKNMSDLELEKRLTEVEIFARVEPAQKLRIVSAWQKKGEVVAMTGDGINDAPALKQADIGIALGSGTDVAQEVSDLVLLTDNFRVIVAAIEEGRAIVDNIRKVIVYLLSDSFAEVILVGVSLLFGWPLPILAGQILWVNLIEDGPMGLSLAFEKKEKDIMKQKPRDYSLSLFTGEMKVLVFIIGIITDLFLLGLFFWLLKYSGYEMAHIRTVIFAGLTIDSLFYIFSCKSLRKSVWQIKLFSNKFLLAFWVLAVGMLLAGIYLPVLQELLKTVPLTLFDWELILGLGIIHIFLIEATKYYFITRPAAKKT
ncbi:HAD-IC family P-type ATPase, partial [Patescibacteria group bacterium]|nr:HAD-IC family P-type ATPase [Patescibacteria group bacterium]